MRLLAVDPGSTTGIARYTSAEGQEDFTSYQLAAMPALDSVHMLLREEPLRPDIVVCERFIVSAATLKKTQAGMYDALDSIGAVRYLCWYYAVPFELQAPAERKFATNARLKQLGWRNPTEGGHADDAARHLLVAAIRRELFDLSIFVKEEE
jgi:hypothetical protein